MLGTDDHAVFLVSTDIAVILPALCLDSIAKFLLDLIQICDIFCIIFLLCKDTEHAHRIVKLHCNKC